MPLPVKRWSVLAFVISFAIASINALAAGEWQIIKINGHDYLTVDNISKFYGLPAEVVPSGAKIQSETADHPLEFERMICSLRLYFCSGRNDFRRQSVKFRNIIDGQIIVSVYLDDLPFAGREGVN